jgi:hypothetical protein
MLCIYRCDNSGWVYRACGEGTTCYPKADGVFCGYRNGQPSGSSSGGSGGVVVVPGGVVVVPVGGSNGNGNDYKPVATSVVYQYGSTNATGTVAYTPTSAVPTANNPFGNGASGLQAMSVLFLLAVTAVFTLNI